MPVKRLLLIAILCFSACYKEPAPAADGSLRGQLTTNCTACSVTVSTTQSEPQTVDFPSTTAKMYFSYKNYTVVHISVMAKSAQSLTVTLWNNGSVQVYQSPSTTVAAWATQDFTYVFPKKD